MDREKVDADRYDDEWIRSAWGSDGADWFQSRDFLCPRPRVQRALDLADLSPGLNVLDIACGRGEVPALAQRAGCLAIGLDFSPSVLKLAGPIRDRINSMGGEPGAHMDLVQADACTLPFASGSFDRVLMLDIIEHLTPAQLDQMFGEVRRVLRPGGYAVLHTLPNRWVYEMGYPLVRFLLLNRLPRQPRGEIEQQVHINEQDLIGLQEKVESCGFHARVWLEQLMPAQARWQREGNAFSDNRDLIYPRLAGMLGRLLSLLSLTPLRLILANDIFGLIWKAGDTAPGVRGPVALTDRLVVSFRRKKHQQQ